MTARHPGAYRSASTKVTGLVVALSLVVASCGVDVDFEVSTDRPGEDASETTVDEETLLASLEGTPHMLWFWAPN